MPPKTIEEAWNDEFSFPEFQKWALATYGYDYFPERDFFENLERFRGEPVAGTAVDMIRNYVGYPGGGWDTFVYFSFEVPVQLKSDTLDKVRTNFPGEGAAELDPMIAVPPDAFDEMEAFVIAQTQPVWDYYLSFNTDPNAEPTSAADTVDWEAAYAKNHANTGAVDDGDELAWAQHGTALLIGDGHDPAAVRYIDVHPETARGRLRVERGSVQYPRGRLRVVGCSDQDNFKWAVREGGSQKHISFRDE